MLEHLTRDELRELRTRIESKALALEREALNWVLQQTQAAIDKNLQAGEEAVREADQMLHGAPYAIQGLSDGRALELWGKALHLRYELDEVNSALQERAGA